MFKMSDIVPIVMRFNSFFFVKKKYYKKNKPINTIYYMKI